MQYWGHIKNPINPNRDKSLQARTGRVGTGTMEFKYFKTTWNLKFYNRINVTVYKSWICTAKYPELSVRWVYLFNQRWRRSNRVQGTLCTKLSMLLALSRCLVVPQLSKVSLNWDCFSFSDLIDHRELFWNNLAKFWRNKIVWHPHSSLCECLLQS